MNERLKELYIQAHSIRRYDGDPALDGNPPTVYWQGEVSAQRFAELIVRECVIQCEREWIRNGTDSVHNQAIHGCINSIKKHFGVE